ncbi:Serine/threonine-protein kinase CTR1 [Diplonema papillatum]|nr:Serine/threonine-protein kinase CTR1 [Diplonema papillatum]
MPKDTISVRQSEFRTESSGNQNDGELLTPGVSNVPVPILRASEGGGGRVLGTMSTRGSTRPAADGGAAPKARRPAKSAGEKAFTRTATLRDTQATRRPKDPLNGSQNGSARADYSIAVPPPPSLSVLHDQKKREDKKVVRRGGAAFHRSRSPVMRAQSPANVNTSFKRSTSYNTNKATTALASVGTNHLASSHRAISPNPYKHAALIRSPSPMANGRSLSRSNTSGITSPPRSPNVLVRPHNSHLLEGISRSIIENFGIEPHDLKIDNSTVLGTGGFGTVYIGDYQATEVAVKVHHTDRSWKAEEIQEWKREVSIMTKLRHPNILMLLGAVFYRTKLAIVTELCEQGTLLRLLQIEKAEDNQLCWGKKFEWMMQVAKGMAFLHHKRIFHRDLKAANVFVTGRTMKIADFGLSRIRRDLLAGHRAESLARPEQHSQQQQQQQQRTNVNDARSFIKPTGARSPGRSRRSLVYQKENSRIQGTFAFIAPEIWSETPYSEKADVYSFGVLITEFLAVAMPFSHDERDELSWRIMVGKTRVRALDNIGGQPVPDELRQIQRACLSFSPEERPYFTDVVSLLRGLMSKAVADETSPWPLPDEVSGEIDPLSEEIDDDDD